MLTTGGERRDKENKTLTNSRHYDAKITLGLSGWGHRVTFPKLSIAAKLYAIFALMATITVALPVVAVLHARHHASLTDQFQAASAGSAHVESVNSLLYAAMLEMRGISMGLDVMSIAPHARELSEVSDRLGAVMADWELSVRNSDASDYSNAAVRIGEFRNLMATFARVATQEGPFGLQAWIDKNRPLEAREKLSNDLVALGRQ